MELRLKTIIGISSLIWTLASSAQGSEVFYAPDLCAPQDLNVVLVNPGKEPLKAWLQVRIGNDIDEIQQEIDSESKVKVSGEEFLKHHQAFTVKTPSNNKLQVVLQCSGMDEVMLGTTTSPTISYQLPEASQSLKLHLLNLYLKSNTVHLKAFAADGAVMAERTTTLQNSYDTQSLKWILPSPAVRVDIQAEARLNAVVLYESRNLELQSPSVVSNPVRFNVDTNKVYFLVSTREEHPDAAFVIALDDPQKIATAREQITHPELEKIVVAKVGLGSGNFNRAFMSADKSPYSWSVTQVDAFADFANIDCDGNPDLVEERLQRKLMEGGRICFWRYRVVRELTPLEVMTGLLLKP